MHCGTRRRPAKDSPRRAGSGRSRRSGGGARGRPKTQSPDARALASIAPRAFATRSALRSQPKRSTITLRTGPDAAPRRRHTRGMCMAEAYIVAAARTAGGRRGGRLSGWHPADLAGQVLNALLDRSGADPALIEDVIMGCVMQVGEQSTNIARNA